VKEMSRSMGIPLENVHCDGCLSDHTSCDCTHGFVSCSRDKKVTWCFQCESFPCERFEEFLNTHIIDGISHHARVVEALGHMKENGVEEWVEEQEDLSKCPKCGKTLHWFARSCPQCQTSVNLH
jgi:hypothetical protein